MNFKISNYASNSQLDICVYRVTHKQHHTKILLNIEHNFHITIIIEMFLKQFSITTIALLLSIESSVAFAPTPGAALRQAPNDLTSHITRRMSDQSGDGAWNGEVVSNTDDGRIRGCTITKVEGALSEWEINIDGEEADLGKFSEAIYKKITSDAKQQRFQGFRPGTLPPHLIPTYVQFAMDECAREATLEALQQNNIRPFDDARMEMTFNTISILPPKKKAKKKKKGKRKKQTQTETNEVVAVQEEPQWVAFESMKEAISAGWKVSHR